MSLKVGVVGAGSWGTALASLLAANGHEVLIWSRGAEVAKLINTRHENRIYLPGVRLHAALRASIDLEEVLTGAELVVMVVPSHAMRETARRAARFISDEAVVVSASKGIEDESCKTMFEVLAETIGDENRIGVLSGPSFAAELSSGQPTVVVAAARQQEVAERIPLPAFLTGSVTVTMHVRRSSRGGLRRSCVWLSP